MACKALGLTVALVAMAPGSSSASPAPAVAASATMTVRVFEQGGVPRHSLDSAAQEAQTIFNRVGLEVSWTLCVGAKHPAACDRQIGADELVVRIVAGPAPAADGSVAMGYALVAPGSRHASLATVYFDLVQSTARSALVDPSRLLGRAIAHEIGHLLLPTRPHSRSGLMRAVWTAAGSSDDQPGDWFFSTDDSRRLRAAAAAR